MIRDPQVSLGRLVRRARRVWRGLPAPWVPRATRVLLELLGLRVLPVLMDPPERPVPLVRRDRQVSLESRALRATKDHLGLQARPVRRVIRAHLALLERLACKAILARRDLRAFRDLLESRARWARRVRKVNRDPQVQPA